MSNQLKFEADDVIVGYRLNKIEKKFDDFLQKLKNAGAELILVFKRSLHTEKSKLKRSSEDQYKLGLDLINQVKGSADFETISDHYADVLRRNLWFEFPSHAAVMLVLCQVAKRYGKLYGKTNLQNHQSNFLAQVANENKAFAILGLNTYHIFHEGSWHFWSDADLDFDLMTVRQFNKEIILRSMNLTFEKGPLFAILAGGLHSSEENVKKITRFFKPWTKRLIENAAMFVSRHKFPLTDESLTNIINQTFGSCPPDLFKEFKDSLNSMTTEKDYEEPMEVYAEIIEMIANDFPSSAIDILRNTPIYISPVYSDLSTNEPKIHDLVVPFIARTSGIMFKNTKDKEPRKVIVLQGNNERLTEIEVQPIIPECKSLTKSIKIFHYISLFFHS